MENKYGWHVCGVIKDSRDGSEKSIDYSTVRSRSIEEAIQEAREYGIYRINEARAVTGTECV